MSSKRKKRATEEARERKLAERDMTRACSEWVEAVLTEEVAGFMIYEAWVASLPVTDPRL